MMYSLDDYFRSQQVSLQWSPVLRAFAVELATQEDVDLDVLRALFVKVGMRFAKDMESQFHGVETLSELAEALNDFWNRTNWGWVELSEGNGCIEIHHRYAPIAEAFGAESLAWSVGILEGFYQAVFRSFGLSDKVWARLVDQQDDAALVHLRLAP
jgi:hypothetical protein